MKIRTRGILCDCLKIYQCGCVSWKRVNYSTCQIWHHVIPRARSHPTIRNHLETTAILRLCLEEQGRYRCMMPGVIKPTAARRQSYQEDHPIQVHGRAVSQPTSKQTNVVARNIGIPDIRNLLEELKPQRSGNEATLPSNGSPVSG